MAGQRGDAERLDALKARIIDLEQQLAEGRGTPHQQREYDAMKREWERIIQIMRAASKRRKDGNN